MYCAFLSIAWNENLCNLDSDISQLLGDSNSVRNPQMSGLKAVPKRLQESLGLPKRAQDKCWNPRAPIAWLRTLGVKRLGAM